MTPQQLASFEEWRITGEGAALCREFATDQMGMYDFEQALQSAYTACLRDSEGVVAGLVAALQPYESWGAQAPPDGATKTMHDNAVAALRLAENKPITGGE